MILKGKTVVLAVTGGIAAFKSCSIVSMLKKKGANVFVIMTKNACKLVAPLTFETLSGNPVSIEMFDKKNYDIEHIALAKRADLFLIAPATANIIAKYAHGICDDLLSTTLQATLAPVMIAPAMNTNMIRAAAYLENRATLIERGAIFLTSPYGALACGDSGEGRMAEPEDIVNSVVNFFLDSKAKNEQVAESLGENENNAAHLTGQVVLITAGSTKEQIDPVRFIGNNGSGKMGVELALSAKKLGAKVILVSGAISQNCQDALLGSGIEQVSVATTNEMHQAVIENLGASSIIIMAASPADYCLKQAFKQKQKGDSLVLELVKNPDIAAEVGKKKGERFLAVFAAETESLKQNAKEKLKKKNADMCIANDVSKEGAGFGVDTNIVSIFYKDGRELDLPLMTKRDLSFKILDLILSQIKK